MDSNRRRGLIFWTLVVASLLAVAFWRYTDIAFPMLQLRIVIVVLSTTAGAAYLVKGILLGFSNLGGWKAATPLLLWAASMLALATWGLWGVGVSIVLCVLCALAASVLAQRIREHPTP